MNTKRPAVLEVQKVSLTFGDRTILEDINLEFEEGKIIAITGKSGAGKSTLLAILSGLMRPDSGKVLFEGQDIFKWGDWKRARFRNRSMGFVFQFFNLFPDMTAFQNILYPATLNPHADKNIRDHVNDLIKLLGIEKISNQYPTTLSGGERQRVAIARSIINNPKIILADEPTGNLDDETTRGIIDLFIRLREEIGITTILATHENELVEHSDRIYHIEDGRVQTHEEGAETLNTIKKRKGDKVKSRKKTVSVKKVSKKKTPAKKIPSGSRKKKSGKSAKKKN